MPKGLERSKIDTDLRFAASNASDNRSFNVLRDLKPKQNDREHRESESSSRRVEDFLRSTPKDHKRQPECIPLREIDNQRIASSSAADQNNFAADLHTEQESHRKADTQSHKLRDSHNRSFARHDASSHVSNERQGRLTDADLRQIEEGLGDTVRNAVREELASRENREQTWGEWWDKRGNTYASVGSFVAGTALTTAGFVYTRWPELIPHH